MDGSDLVSECRAGVGDLRRNRTFVLVFAAGAVMVTPISDGAVTHVASALCLAVVAALIWLDGASQRRDTLTQR